ncbi:hypothetical protein F511_03964 [Dorcoceras hygrometricum]|uniref:Uncharacterized protein n=1 Tax=Dorcoceras hygrometricum TaxID=472368 RepID=A0A2Z7B1Y4_9LAMI|nr:hypothetical protein F511_03964 [Dorcoceras hygrometricum]
MADDTDEIFDFSNLEFTCEDLVTTLNDMVQEYKKLSQSFKKVKAKKDSCANKAKLVSSSDLQATLSKLATENEELRSRSEEMVNENKRLARIINSWTRSSTSLNKLHGSTKPSGYKIGLGYNRYESNTAKTNCTSSWKEQKITDSFFVNAMQVDFASMLSMEHTGITCMFKTLEDTGLKGFLAACGFVYESVVVEFFANANVVEGKVISSVANRKLVLTKEAFAEAFGLTTEGMEIFLDISNRTVVDM